MDARSGQAPDVPPSAGRIAVLGAGSWGTALAYSLAAKSGRDVALWARRPEAAAAIAATRRNERYLPQTELPASIVVTSDIDEALRDAWLWVFAVPSQSVRRIAELAASRVTPAVTVVSVAKGIERDRLLTTTGVLREALPDLEPGRAGVLYGPSHAEEVAAGLPTSVVVAFPDHDVGAAVRDAFIAPALRVYFNDDLVGVEVAGSVKNVMALAAGIGDGLGLGDNAKAALVTRGLWEITRLGLELGAEMKTFAGLAGLGDLVVTCFSRHSRNRLFGEKIGAGRTLDEARAEMTMIAEGVETTVSTRELARRRGVEMPITEAVYRVLFEGLDARDAVDELMTREPKLEHVAGGPDGARASPADALSPPG